MVESVLSTFDDSLTRNPWTRLYRTLVEHLPQLPGLGKLSERPVPRWKSLFEILSEGGVKVEVYSPPGSRPFGRNVEHELSLLEEKLQSADLIFHNYGIMRRNPSVSRDLASRVSRLIDEKYQHKSHLLGQDKLYIAERMEEAGIPIPQTMEVEDYLREGMGSNPVVVKQKKSSLGRGVLYLDRSQTEMLFSPNLTPEMVALVHVYLGNTTFLGRLVNTIMYTPHIMHIPGNEALGKRRRRQILSLINPKNYFVQEFIETPSDRFTSYRILTVGGEILGCVINASGQTKENAMAGKGWPKEFYQSLASAVSTHPIVSNYSAGGVQIEVYPRYYCILNERNQQILRDHGIDPDARDIPKPLKELAQLAGRELTKYGMVIAGQDWLQDSKGNFYFLEGNPSPGLNIFRTLFFGGGNTHGEYLQFAANQIAGALHRYAAPAPPS